MAYATKKLDPFGARMLSIRLQQKKGAPSAPEAAATDACCPSRDVECMDDDVDPLGGDEPTFDVEGVSTGCDDCGMGLSGATPVNADPMIALKDEVNVLTGAVAALMTRVNELEMREDTLVKSLVDSGALPGYRSLGA